VALTATLLVHRLLDLLEYNAIQREELLEDFLRYRHWDVPIVTKKNPRLVRGLELLNRKVLFLLKLDDLGHGREVLDLSTARWADEAKANGPSG
jgi:hypothetical protein